MTHIVIIYIYPRSPKTILGTTQVKEVSFSDHLKTVLKIVLDSQGIDYGMVTVWHFSVSPFPRIGAIPCISVPSVPSVPRSD